LEQNEICGRQPDLQCGLDLVVLMVLIEANIYFSFSGGFLYFRGGRWWTVLVEDRIEPNRTEINRFESVFNLVWFKHFFKKFNLIIYFSLKPDRTGNPQLPKRTWLRMRMNIESDLTCNTWSYGLSISFSPVPCGKRKKTNQVFFPPLSRTGSGTHSQIPNPILAVDFFFWIPTLSI
jgi:hypothetical protein